MKQYLVIIFISLHLMSSCLYATKTFLDKDYIHINIQKNIINIHHHHHSHNGVHHQHKHSHIQMNISYADLFTDINNKSLYDFENPKQLYLETASLVPNPTPELIFRPPII